MGVLVARRVPLPETGCGRPPPRQDARKALKSERSLRATGRYGMTAAPFSRVSRPAAHALVIALPRASASGLSLCLEHAVRRERRGAGWSLAPDLNGVNERHIPGLKNSAMRPGFALGGQGNGTPA